MRCGKVYLVGAGPGHPELLTLKAAKLLETGDVIVYDRLIQEEVLALAKPSAERIYMGKKVGLHESRQEEIHDLLLSKAREGKTVVRLKGGDPFLFGRGGEEAEFLAEHGVPFEVVPGVSSALAAPLSAGIAVTHRDAASAIAIVTGHEASRVESRLNWQALAGMDTLVFLMAVRNTGRIARELIAHGRDPQTPAAMIQMAFWHGEKVITGTLATIAEEVERAGIDPPATLVVGETVRLREKLRTSQRDLRRRSDDSSHFIPAPAPDQLIRMATAGIGSQVLGFALATSLFDQLEQWRTAQELARLLGLNTLGLAEVLECLVSLGLLESGAAGYRNLELASRYLVENSPQSLKPALLYQVSHGLRLTAVGRYALNGRYTAAPDGGDPLHAQACECLARYGAPFVMEKLDLAAWGPVLFIGWGGEAYREMAARRWPELSFRFSNPFAADERCNSAAAVSPVDGGPYGAVLLSGVLGSCEQGQFQAILEDTARLLKAGGRLILHDEFLRAKGPSAPEIVLPAFERRVTRGGCRTWSVARLRRVLESLDLELLQTDLLGGGSWLVTAHKAAPALTEDENPTSPAMQLVRG